jgi:hypothetical protein
VHIHIHHHWDGSIQADLAELSRKLDLILQRELKLMQGEDDLKAALASLATAVTAVGARITQLMNTAAGDPDADIETLAQQVNAEVATLNSAVAVAPTPTPPAP